jgi:hypothetical protein
MISWYQPICQEKAEQEEDVSPRATSGWLIGAKRHDEYDNAARIAAYRGD